MEIRGRKGNRSERETAKRRKREGESLGVWGMRRGNKESIATLKKRGKETTKIEGKESTVRKEKGE